jgi:prolycopene isomerase
VETKDGRRVGTQQIISNIAARATFFNLIGEEKLPTNYTATLRKNEVSLSGFYVYLGIDCDPKEAGITVQHSMVYETYDVSKGWELLLKGEFVIPFFGLSEPTLVDPSLAPPEKHVVILDAIAPYNWIGRSWREEKETVARGLIRKAERLIPNLSQHIVVQDVATPLTFERYTSNSLGAVMGWALSTEMFGNLPAPKTPIENLYLAGHWTRPGTGTAAAALSGLRTARLILGEETTKDARERTT